MRLFSVHLDEPLDSSRRVVYLVKTNKKFGQDELNTISLFIKQKKDPEHWNTRGLTINSYYYLRGSSQLFDTINYQVRFVTFFRDEKGYGF